MILSIGILIFLFAFKSEENMNSGNKPKNGFVPDETTAINVAKAILVPIYGEQVLTLEPYTAFLNKNEVWVVKGSLPYVEGRKGGVPRVEIQKIDCKIIHVSHGK